MKNRFIITTTDTIENCPIKRYIDTICSNIVIGTNVFSDFAASVTDFFGGRSGSYKRKLQIIYNEASKELKQKAINLGANAIVGFKVDFDEISSRDKSMFMVSVSGTACIIEKNDEDIKAVDCHSQISSIDLQKEIQRRYIVSRIKKSSPICKEWVEFLLENPQIEIVEDLIKRYISLDVNYNSNEVEVTNIKQILSVIPANHIIPFVYKYFKYKKIRDLIEKYNLFDSNSIYEIIKQELHIGIHLLSATKEYYNTNDLQGMKRILEYLNNLPNTGNIENVKGGIFSKCDEKKFVCENGHKNSIDFIFCEKCGINIKGLNEEELNIIEEFKEKCNIIEDYIN
ncbi:YbjQ family protein [Barnesiella intestinihominis]|jgi:uncharacterized protein YbjQ (UPF0145 family)|uniref:YbjQ family protein n=1 Tax=Barnesiella intestinihominis TaxID=487174 RepID=UPI00189ABBD7|nr:YbjQ family protein [Barnesiella intestinihominis]MDB0679355.1 YbjQ family protein [Barnesiella intestinihominis]MDB0685007.1 YbjQ family protein [Barnesiella intestinihominis]